MHEFFRQQWQALSYSLGFDFGSTFNQSFGSQTDTDYQTSIFRVSSVKGH